MIGNVFAVCKHRTKPKCNRLFRVVNPVTNDKNRLVNLCPHCRGPLRKVGGQELREQMGAHNDLGGER